MHLGRRYIAQMAGMVALGLALSLVFVMQVRAGEVRAPKNNAETTRSNLCNVTDPNDPNSKVTIFGATWINDTPIGDGSEARWNESAALTPSATTVNLTMWTTAYNCPSPRGESRRGSKIFNLKADPNSQIPITFSATEIYRGDSNPGEFTAPPGAITVNLDFTGRDSGCYTASYTGQYQDIRKDKNGNDYTSTGGVTAYQTQVCITRPVIGYVQGRVFNDLNGDGMYDSGEPYVQRGTNCGSGYPNLETYVSVSNSGNWYPNNCGPSPSLDPYFRTAAVSSGEHTVSVVPPPGYTATSPAKKVNVPSDGSAVDIWFGIHQNPPTPPAPTVETGCNGTNSVATIRWTAVSGYSNYIVDIDDNSDFASGSNKYVSNILSTTAPDGFSNSLVLTPGTTYYYRVYYYNNSSNIRTQLPNPSFVATGCASAPSVSQRCEAGTTAATITWSEVPNFSRYIVDIDDNSDFGSGSNKYVDNSTSTDAPAGFSNSLVLNAGTRYYFRVYYYNNNYSFRTQTPNPSFVAINCTPRIPYVSVSKGDVHAGGGISGNCTNGSVGDVTGIGDGQTDYVVSAIKIISGFKSGGGTDNLTIKKYGKVCRPDLVANVQRVPAYSTAVTRNATNCGTAATIPVNANNLYKASCLGGAASILKIDAGSNVTLGAGTLAVGPRTIYVAGGNLVLSGNIAPGTTGTRLTTPTLGLIVNGDVYINKNVTNLTNVFIWATGRIHTCANGTTDAIPNGADYNSTPCNAQLTLTGMMMAKDYAFLRTDNLAAQNNTGSGHLNKVLSEQVTFTPLLYMSPPPGFGDSIAIPQYTGERSPRI